MLEITLLQNNLVCYYFVFFSKIYTIIKKAALQVIELLDYLQLKRKRKWSNAKIYI